MNISNEIYNSKGELWNSCPYLDSIRDYILNLPTKNDKTLEILKDIEYVRAINDALRNGKSDKIDYDLIEKKIYEATDNSKLQDEIDDLKYKVEEYEKILYDVSQLSPRLYKSLNYTDLAYDLKQVIDEKEKSIEGLKSEILALQF